MARFQHLGKTKDQVLRDLQRLKQQFPLAIGRMAVAYFRRQFIKGVEGYLSGEGKIDKWKPRKKKQTPERPILVKTGRLRDAISVLEIVPGQKVVVGIADNVVPYASAHNYGFTKSITVRQHARKNKDKVSQVKAHTRKMNFPARQFIGMPNNGLSVSIRRFTERQLSQALNG